MKYALTILLIYAARLILAQNVIGVHTVHCDTSGREVYMHQSRLISKDIKNDTLKLKIGIELRGRRCTEEPEIGLEIAGDSLLIDIQTKSSPNLQRIHYAEIEIDAVGIIDTSFTLFQKKINHIDGDSLIQKDGDLDVFNQISVVTYVEMKEHPTKYKFPSLSEIERAPNDNQLLNDSLRVAYWVIKNKNRKSIQYKAYYFIDHTGQSRASWFVDYDKKGHLLQVCAFEGITPEGESWYSCLNRKQYLKENFEEPK